MKTTGKFNIDDLPLLKDYTQFKSRLSVRLTNPDRVKPGAVFKPFLDLAVTCHIDVADSVSCTVNSGLLEYLGVEKDRLFSDAMENSMKTRPAVTMPIEECLGKMGFPGFDDEAHLMIATTEGLSYGAAVVVYPGFLERVSRGRNLFFINTTFKENEWQ